MTTELDNKIDELKLIDSKIEDLSALREQIRQDIFSLLQQENLVQYKGAGATLSIREVKIVKLIKPKEQLLSELPKKYIVTIPQQVIPEQKDFSPELERDVKNGIKVKGLELETKVSLSVRINK